MASSLKDYLVGIGFEVDEGGAQKANDAISGLDDLVTGLGGILKTTLDSLKTLIDEFSGGAGKINETADGMDAAAQAADSLADSEQQAAQGVADAADAAAQSASAMDMAADAAGTMADSTDHAAGAADALADSEDRAASGMRGASDAASQQSTALSKASGSADKLGSSIDKVGKESAKTEKALRDVNKKAKLEGAKEGSKNAQGLADGMKKAADTAKRLAAAAVGYIIGNSFKDAMVDTYVFMESIGDTAKAMKKGVEETRAYQTALNLMGKSAEDIKKSGALTQAFNELQALGAQMALPEAAQGVTAIRTLKDTFLQLKMVGNYALQWLMYKIQTVAEGPLMEIQDIMTGMKNWFVGNVEKIATVAAQAFAYVTQTVSSVIKFVGMLFDAINSLPTPIKTTLAIALAAIAMIKSKFALITAVITGITLLIDDFVTYLEGGDSLFGDFWGKCIEWAEKVRPFVEGFISCFSTGLQAISDAFTWLCDLVGTDVIVAIGLVGAALWALSANPIVLIIGAVVGLIAGLGWLIQNWDTVKAKAEEVWSAVKEWIVGAWNSVVEAWNGVGAWFTGIWESIQSAFSSVGEWFSGIFTTARESVETAFSTVVDFFSGIWTSIQSNPILAGLFNYISAPFRIAVAVVKAIWNSVVGFFQGIWDLITGNGTLADLWTKISQPFTDA